MLSRSLLTRVSSSRSCLIYRHVSGGTFCTGERRRSLQKLRFLVTAASDVALLKKGCVKYAAIPLFSSERARGSTRRRMRARPAPLFPLGSVNPCAVLFTEETVFVACSPVSTPNKHGLGRRITVVYIFVPRTDKPLCGVCNDPVPSPLPLTPASSKQQVFQAWAAEIIVRRVCRGVWKLHDERRR